MTTASRAVAKVVFGAMVFLGALGWVISLYERSLFASASRIEAEKSVEFERGKLAAMCASYCKDLSSEELPLEGHVVAVGGDPERCRCMLAEFPPRASEVP